MPAALACGKVERGGFMNATRIQLAQMTGLLLCWLATPLAAQAPAPAQTPAPTFKPEELEQIVAPIALYPDALLAQVLMASTYPLEIVEAARWSRDNPNVKGDAVADAVQAQTWDPSVKSLAVFPDVLTMMNEKLDWTQKLGDAFLAQQADVMDAVQRLRTKAQKEGTLKSSKEQKVSTEKAPAAPAADAAAAPPAAAPAAATTTVIKIEPANPQVVYVPTYNPAVVYGTWPYPAYPPYYYYPPGYAAGAAFFSFGVGMVVGSALWGGCHWGWGHGDIDINVNNYNRFNRTNINNIDRNNIGNGTWKHDPAHRKGVQYRDNATQSKFGKARDPSAIQSREAFRGRADQGRQDLARDGATRDLAGNRINSRDNGAGGLRSQTGNLGDGGRTGQQLGNSRNPASATRPSTRDSSFGSSSRQPDAYRGMSSGSATRMNSQRGFSSRSSGGFSRGGGGGGRRR